MNIGIVYGSNQGNTESVSEKAKDILGASECLNITEATPEQIQSWDLIVIATSTWGDGELPEDWEYNQDKLNEVNFNGKTVAFIGLGDQYIYGSTFCDALKLLYDKMEGQDFKLVGLWPTDGYEHEDTIALLDGKFLGVAIDEDNEPDLTDERLEKWADIVKEEAGL